MNYRIQSEIKLVADINPYWAKVKSALSNTRLVSSISPIFYFHENHHLLVTPTVSFNLMVGRGMGSSMRDNKFRLRGHAIISFGAGYQWGTTELQHRVQMLSHILQSGFRSDFNNIILLSSNAIFIGTHKADNKTNYLRQRVGGVYVGLKNIEIMYSNDGPPFSKWMGDGKDRYWTGSIAVGYKFIGNNNQPINIRWSYDRYTSYNENAYELATALKMDYVPYRSYLSNLYNRSSTRIGVFVDNQFNAEFCINDNDDVDIQNLLHRWQGFAFHRTANISNYSLQVSKSFIPKTISK